MHTALHGYTADYENASVNRKNREAKLYRH